MTTGRSRCAQWAASLWARGYVPSREGTRLASTLRRIANGEDPRDALDVRSKGRPRKLSFAPLANEPAGSDDQHVLVLCNGRKISLQVAEVLTHTDGDPKQVRMLLALVAAYVAKEAMLPRAWNGFVAAALWNVASGMSPEQAFKLTRSRGNRASPLRDAWIARIADELSALTDGKPKYMLVAQIAEALELTDSKGRRRELTPERVRDIHVSGKKAPE